MAPALFSRRSSSGPAACPGRAAARPANRNKTITNCLGLGLIFSTSTTFFRPFDEKIDAALNIRLPVMVEMQLRDVPQAQADGQFVTQIMPSALQSRHRLLALLVVPAHHHLDI